MELNQIPFGGHDNDNIVQDKTCIYIGLQKSSVPQCQEGFTERDIQSDSEPNVCGINHKRVDGLFGERQFFNVSVDSSFEFKGYSYQECLPETAINGGACQPINKTERVWVKWSKDDYDWTGCRDFCEGR